MITVEYVDSKKEFVDIARKQQWLESDTQEAFLLGVKDVPTAFDLMRDIFLKMAIVKNDGKIIAMIALQFDNQLVYFNTEAVRSCLKSYLKFLKQFVQEYVKERSYISVYALNDYITTNKKLKFIGFKKVHIGLVKTKWVAGI